VSPIKVAVSTQLLAISFFFAKGILAPQVRGDRETALRDLHQEAIADLVACRRGYVRSFLSVGLRAIGFWG
jgi:hypothetical protein